MTLKKISSLKHSDNLTLPDLPEEFLEVAIFDNDEEQIEVIEDSYPLALSDVTRENIISSKKLTDGENVKEIYLMEVTTSFTSFNPGDTISIITKNQDDDLEKLFNQLRITDLSKKNCKICMKPVPLQNNLGQLVFLNKITTLHLVFAHCLDIWCTPKKSLIRLLSEFTKDLKEKRQLEELCSKEKSDLYVKNILEANKTFLDILLMYPSCCPPVARIIENLPRLLPRPYSIASSPLMSPNKVKVVFSVVQKNSDRIVRNGLCTGMLKHIINEINEEKKVKLFFRKCNGFNLPESDVPLILVGPGTGIAPFMGFLEHRMMQKRKGTVWLFYGCHSKKGDYLFEKELQHYQELGILTKLCVAFSREIDAEAKYVQDNIRKYGKELCELIFEKAAMIYVCGDAKNMRKSILTSFIEVFENQKGMTNKEATEHLKKLQKEKRYLQDIWN